MTSTALIGSVSSVNALLNVSCFFFFYYYFFICDFKGAMQSQCELYILERNLLNFQLCIFLNRLIVSIKVHFFPHVLIMDYILILDNQMTCFV